MARRWRRSIRSTDEVRRRWKLDRQPCKTTPTHNQLISDDAYHIGVFVSRHPLPTAALISPYARAVLCWYINICDCGVATAVRLTRFVTCYLFWNTASLASGYANKLQVRKGAICNGEKHIIRSDATMLSTNHYLCEQRLRDFCNTTNPAHRCVLRSSALNLPRLDLFFSACCAAFRICWKITLRPTAIQHLRMQPITEVTRLVLCFFVQYIRTKWRRNIAENFSRLSRAHERYRQTTDRRTDVGRWHNNTWREFTFAKNHKICFSRLLLLRLFLLLSYIPRNGAGILITPEACTEYL